MKKITLTSTDAKLSNINVRTEGNPTSPVIAIDLKFEAIMDGAILSDLCGADDVPPLWLEDGSVKYLGLAGFTARTELEGCTLEFGDLVLSKIKLEGVKVNKLVFAPTSGRAMKIGLRAQLKPTDEELQALTHALQKTAELHIEALLGFQGDDAGDAKDLLDNEDDQDD